MSRAASQTRHASAWDFARGNALTLTLFAALLFGCLVVVFHGGSYRTVGALLWSLGFAAAGVLLGFLFAVPRPSRTAPALPVAAIATPAVAGAAQPGQATTAQPPLPAVNGVSAGAAAAANAGMEINTNLMEISDWLTKIIVGVGLVELKQLPAHAESVARFMAPSLHDTLGVPLAGAIMLYFSVLGFLGGYLLTRIYISQWFRWADEQTRGQVQLESGKLVDVDELTRLQQPVIEDLQQQVAALVERHTGEGAAAAAAAAPAGARPALRILWADDQPQNNTLQVNMIEREGHRVETVLDTAQALAALKAAHYDVLITDMHRIERGKENPTAGLDLLRAAKELQPGLTALVFCSRYSVQRHGDEARRLGAALVTESGTALLAALRARAPAAA